MADYQFGADYWNNKWPKSTVIYGGRALRTKQPQIGIDVTEFITPHDAILQQIVIDYKLTKDTPNATAWACQQWVVKFLTYIEDSKSSSEDEFWQYPYEVVQYGIGDCEDGAILMANLMINAGIPTWRVKCAAGYVQQAPTAPQGGHCYCLFLADVQTEEKKLAWKIMDWCYAEDSKLSVEQKPFARDGGYKGWYKDVWFTFNADYAWAADDVTIPQGRVSQNSAALKEQVAQSDSQMMNSIMSFIQKKVKK